jgi:transcriptional regulator with XRE-family HTH domain
VLRTNLPRALRHLRRHRRWRQSDLAKRSGVSRQVIARIELGDFTATSIRTVADLAQALDASVDLTVRWQGEELDRLVDAAHAHLVARCVELLASLGWDTRVEVSFNHYGDRGRVDVLAFHGSSRMLVVTEVKSALGDAQETLGRLDVKTRLGPVLAGSVGWPVPIQVVPALVIGDSRRARRIVGEHAALFMRFSVRGREAVSWLRSASGPAPSGLLWFASVPDSRGMGVTRRGRVRVGS